MSVSSAPSPPGIMPIEGTQSSAPMSCAQVPVTVRFNGHAWTYVGMRFKGNSSLSQLGAAGNRKLPFRLDFDQYEDAHPEVHNQRFYGFKKLTLSANFGDDSQVRDVVVYTLQREGHGVTAVHDGRAALDALLGPSCRHFDLVVLDILMPEVDGLEVCRRLRASQRAHLPVVFLSSRDEEIDKVLGLEMGGDDYVTKPFSPRELALRAQAIVRRSRRAPDTEQIVNGALVIDPAARTASHDGTVLHLSDVEFRLLAALARRPGQPVGVRDLLNEVWHTTETAGGRDMIKTTVHRLRHRLGPAGGLIVTVRGVGYLMPALDAD